MKRALVLAALLALVTACAGTETGNPSVVQAQLGFVGHTSDALRVGFSGDDAPVEVDELSVFVGSVDFHVACDEPAGSDAELDDVGALDLLAAEQNVHEFEIAPEAYCAVTVSLAAAPMSGVPASLAARSIVIAGTRSDGVPFRWEASEAFELRLVGTESAVHLDAEHRAYVVGPDVVGLVGNVDLSHAVVAADGIAHLDAPENATFDATIHSALEPATSLVGDDDEDGAIGPSETPILHGHHP